MKVKDALIFISLKDWVIQLAQYGKRERTPEGRGNI